MQWAAIFKKTIRCLLKSVSNLPLMYYNIWTMWKCVHLIRYLQILLPAGEQI